MGYVLIETKKCVDSNVYSHLVESRNEKDFRMNTGNVCKRDRAERLHIFLISTYSCFEGSDRKCYEL